MYYMQDKFNSKHFVNINSFDAHYQQVNRNGKFILMLKKLAFACPPLEHLDQVQLVKS